MYWGRYDDCHVATYRDDGSLKYRIRQRNYAKPTSVVYEIEDGRSFDEARQDYYTVKELGLPQKATADHIYTKGLSQEFAKWAGDDTGYLTLNALWSFTHALSPFHRREHSTPAIAVGTDPGQLQPLEKRNRQLGQETARREADHRVGKRFVEGDMSVFETVIDGLEGVLYETGLFLHDRLFCRHILSRPIVTADKTKVKFSLVSV